MSPAPQATRASSDAVATITADAMDCTPESAPGAAAATDSSIDGTNNSVSVSAAAALAAGEVDLRALSTSMLLSASLPPALDATIEVLRVSV